MKKYILALTALLSVTGYVLSTHEMASTAYGTEPSMGMQRGYMGQHRGMMRRPMAAGYRMGQHREMMRHEPMMAREGESVGTMNY